MNSELFEIINTLSDDLIQIVNDENILKPILEIGTDVLDTSIPGFKLVIQVTNRMRLMKFKYFLKGIYSICQNNDISGNVLSEKIKRLTKKKLFSEFIVNTYESAIEAKSINNTAILGYYLGKNAFLEKDICLEDIIICNCLRQITDLETEIFFNIYDKVKLMDGDDKIEFLDPRNISNLNYDIYSVQLVIEELKNHRIVGRGIGSFDYIEQFGVCIFTNTTHNFYKLIKETHLFSKLL
jgi:hypothetical protein